MGRCTVTRRTEATTRAPLSAGARATSRLGRGRNPSAPRSAVTPASGRRRRLSTARGTGWPKSRATGAVDLQTVVQLLEAILDVAPLAIDLLIDPLGVCFMLVMTNRGLSFGFLPSWRTTSALMITRRAGGQRPGRVAGFAVDVLGLAAPPESLRACRIAGLALRFRTAFLAMATTYSTLGSASRKSSSCGWAKPPSSRTRMRASEKLTESLQNSPQNPDAPIAAAHCPAAISP